MLDKIFPDMKTDGDGVASFKGKALSTSAGQCVAQNKLPNAAVAQVRDHLKIKSITIFRAYTTVS